MFSGIVEEMATVEAIKHLLMNSASTRAWRITASALLWWKSRTVPIPLPP